MDSNVRVSYTVKPEAEPAPAAAATALPVQQTVPSVRRVPTTPFTHVRYTWTMQSSVAAGSRPPRYFAYYYVASTNAIVEKPLPLPIGATLVDVFPDDCVFSMQDELGHSFTFKNAKEALRRRLDPGTWSVYPVKCGGIDVFLR